MESTSCASPCLSESPGAFFIPSASERGNHGSDLGASDPARGRTPSTLGTNCLYSAIQYRATTAGDDLGAARGGYGFAATSTKSTSRLQGTTVRTSVFEGEPEKTEEERSKLKG